MGGSLEDDLGIEHVTEESEKISESVEQVKESIWSGICSAASWFGIGAIAFGWLSSSGATMNNLDPVRYDFLSNNGLNPNNATLTLANNEEVHDLFYEQLFVMGYIGRFAFRYFASLYNTPNNAAHAHSLTSDVANVVNLCKQITSTGEVKETILDMRNARILLDFVSLGTAAWLGYGFTKPDYTQALRLAKFTGLPIELWWFGAGVSGACVWKGVTDSFSDVVTQGVLPSFSSGKKNKYLKSVGLEQLDEEELRIYTGRKIFEGVIGIVVIVVSYGSSAFYTLYRYQGMLLAPQASLSALAEDNNITVLGLIANSHMPGYEVPAVQPAEAEFLNDLANQATPELFFLGQLGLGFVLWGCGKLYSCFKQCCTDKNETFEWPDPDKSPTFWYVSLRKPTDEEKARRCCLLKYIPVVFNSAPDDFTPTERRMAVVSSVMLVLFVPFVAMYTRNLGNQDTQDALAVMKANPLVAWVALMAPMLSGYALGTIKSAISWQRYPDRQPLAHLEQGFQDDDGDGNTSEDIELEDVRVSEEVVKERIQNELEGLVNSEQISEEEEKLLETFALKVFDAAKLASESLPDEELALPSTSADSESLVFFKETVLPSITDPNVVEALEAPIKNMNRPDE